MLMVLGPSWGCRVRLSSLYHGRTVFARVFRPKAGPLAKRAAHAFFPIPFARGRAGKKDAKRAPPRGRPIKAKKWPKSGIFGVPPAWGGASKLLRLAPRERAPGRLRRETEPILCPLSRGAKNQVRSAGGAGNKTGAPEGTPDKGEKKRPKSGIFGVPPAWGGASKLLRLAPRERAPGRLRRETEPILCPLSRGAKNQVRSAGGAGNKTGAPEGTPVLLAAALGFEPR